MKEREWDGGRRGKGEGEKRGTPAPCAAMQGGEAATASEQGERGAEPTRRRKAGAWQAARPQQCALGAQRGPEPANGGRSGAAHLGQSPGAVARAGRRVQRGGGRGPPRPVEPSAPPAPPPWSALGGVSRPVESSRPVGLGVGVGRGGERSGGLSVAKVLTPKVSTQTGQKRAFAENGENAVPTKRALTDLCRHFADTFGR